MTGRLGLALGIAALVLFGAFYGIGSATSGGDESEPASQSEAVKVDVPDASSGAPNLASAGGMPKLRPAN